MKRKLNLIIKRVIDFLGAALGIIILLPILIIIALSIKTTSKGPIFFRQERLGKEGKVFKIIKFRTMVVNAEKVGDGIRVKAENDTRITKIGRLLRKTSLDELPQFWNVLIGDMSLVGPRPPVTYHPHRYNEYDSYQIRRFTMKPGITGLAQVISRNSVSWDERIKMDIKYIDEFNVLLDVKILFQTINKIFKSDNIYGAKETSIDRGI